MDDLVDNNRVFTNPASSDTCFWKKAESFLTKEQTDSIFLDDLPQEILLEISRFLDPGDIHRGLFATNSWLNQIFSDDFFWQLRMKQQYPHRWTILTNSVVKQADFWRKNLICFDKKNRRFLGDKVKTKFFLPWTISNQHKHLWSLDCVTFCNRGNLLVAGGSSPNAVTVWDVHADSAKEDAKISQNIYHSSKVSSVRSKGHLISSASWDKTICVNDLLAVYSTEPLQRLRTKHPVFFHEWDDDCIVTGTDENSFEIFDIRTAKRTIPVQEFVSHARTRRDCQWVKPKLIKSRVLLAGWKNGERLLKLFDMRNLQFVAEVEVSVAGYASQYTAPNPEMCIDKDNNQLWFGAEEKVLQFEISTLRMMAEYSVAADGQLVGIHSGNGHLLTVVEKADMDSCSGCYQTQMYEIRNGLHKIWEHAVPTGSQKKLGMDYSEERCAIGLALHDRVAHLELLHH